MTLVYDMLEIGKEYKTKNNTFILILAKMHYCQDGFPFVGETRNGLIVRYNQNGVARGFKDEVNYDLELTTYTYCSLAEGFGIKSFHPLSVFDKKQCIEDKVYGFIRRTNGDANTDVFLPLDKVFP